MNFEIGFGTGVQTFEVADKNYMGTVLPNQVQVELTGTEEVARALKSPIESPPLRDIVKPGEKIVIITSDNTRPLPSYQILPLLLQELEAAEVSLSDVSVVLGLGSHRPLTDSEIRKLVGDEAFSKVRCENSTPDDCVHFGKTSYGTPVDISRTVAEADRRIALGNIEYHYFAGYSGGAKALMPGVSTREAIQANHSRMTMAQAVAGRLEDNPVRQDIEESLNFCPLDFILNVILDEQKQIMRAFAGHPVHAHRMGCKFLDQLYLIPLEKKADIVIASQGGAPKDINLYQTQKALDNAQHAVRDRGIIILAGSCKEGLGEEVFEDWMKNSPNPESMIERINREFQLGGHKAAAIAMILKKADIYLVSDMDAEFVKSIFLQPFPTVQSALDAAFAKLGGGASVLVMPYGGSTLPVVE